MGVVNASSSAARSLVGLGSKHSTQRPGTGRSVVVAFKSDKHNDTAIVVPQEKVISPVEATKRKRRTRKNSTRADGPTCPLDVDYNEAAAKLESIYKLSPAPASSDVEEDVSGFVRIGRQTKRSIDADEEKAERKRRKPIIRNLTKKPRRLGLRRRLELKQNKEAEAIMAINRTGVEMDEQGKIQELVRGYYFSTDLVAMDWSKVKIPPVLSSTEQTWLFKLVQPMKALLQAKKELTTKLEREPTDSELAYFGRVDVSEVRKQMEVGRAARNKLIKHNLRLVLYVINKRFSHFANRSRFQDLCQEGAKGLITAIDRFEPSRISKLSTYSLFWIRHAIIRSMTVSNIIRVSFGLESVRSEIQKAKMELMSSLQRKPTEDEIIQKVGITRKRYNEVMNAFKPILSLNSRHAVTQEELINQVADTDGGHMERQQALFRLALDDVLDSLKPKESLVIRQRYGLDGKGDRTLQEIAGNLNISREMVRKYEVKALMKLKHPARLDYLRRYVA